MAGLQDLWESLLTPRSLNTDATGVKPSPPFGKTECRQCVVTGGIKEGVCGSDRMAHRQTAHHEPSRHRSSIPRRKSLRRHTLAPMPGVFPDYPAPVIHNTDAGTEMTLMRWGMPPPPRTGGPTGHQHPQHVITALARTGRSRRTDAWSQPTASPNTRRSRTRRRRKRTWCGSR